MLDNTVRINRKGQKIATYSFAGHAVKIKSIYREIHLMCSDYVTDATEEFEISTTEEEIQNEKGDFKKSKSGEADEQNTRDNYIETLLIYRKIALKFLDFGILLMHGSCIAVDGEGVLFTALSGTGKSTHTRLWREMLGDRAIMVNDDKPLVAVKKDSAPIIYGTPWDGKHHLSTNIGVPLKAIVYLQRGGDNEIHEISPMEIMPVLIQQTFCMPDALITMKVLELLDSLARNVKFYDLHCNMNPEAAEKAYSTIFDACTGEQ